jgi:hypothetical protein
VTLGGYVWAQRQPADASGSAPARFSDGLFLGLSGHLCLMLLAVNPAWSIPPWPVFGTLVVLTLATSVAALAVRAGAFHVAGTAAAAMVVLAWTIAAAGRSWGLVALLAATGASAFALGWIAIARRRDLTTAAAAGAVVSLFVAEATAMGASGVAGRAVHGDRDRTRRQSFRDPDDRLVALLAAARGGRRGRRLGRGAALAVLPHARAAMDAAARPVRCDLRRVRRVPVRPGTTYSGRSPSVHRDGHGERDVLLRGARRAGRRAA